MKKTKKVLASLAIAGMLATMVPFNVFASDSVPAMGTRLAGVTAYDTAQQIAQQYASADSVVLAAGMTRNSVDALAAGPLAAQLKAPILLTDGSGTLAPQAKAELQRLMPKKVYITSGTAVIKPEVLDQVKAITGADSVVALGGYDAFETSLNIAKKMVELGAKPTGIVVAGGWATPADALSAASIASAKGMPILAVAKDGLNSNQVAFVNSLQGVTNSYIVGGTAVVSAAVEATLPGTVARLADTTQYGTNLKVLEKFADVKYDKVFVANGKTFVDALAGAPLAAKYSAPIVLADQTVDSGLATYVQGKLTDASTVIALGGTAAVPESVLAAVKAPVVVPTTMSVVSVSAINANGVKGNLENGTISRNATFQVKFSANFAKDTVSNKTLKIFQAGVLVPITTPNTYADTVEFNTQSPLDEGVTYSLVIDGVKSSDGVAVAKKEVAFKAANEVVVKNVTVTDGGLNTGAANSTLYNPGYQAVANVTGTWINASDRFTVTLDEAVDYSTFTSSSVKLIDAKTGRALAVQATLGALNTQIDVKVVGSTDFLMPKTQYKLVLDGIKAANGTNVEQFNFNFSYNEAQPTVQNVYVGNTSNVVGTGSNVDHLVNPTLSSMLLSDKSTYKEGAKLAVDFGAANAKLVEASVNTDNFKVRVKDTKEEAAVTVKYVSDTNKVEIVPNAPLKGNTEYEVVVSPYLKNVNGLTLGSKDSDEVKVTFRTLDATAPKVESVSIVSGDLNDLQVGDTATIQVKFSEAIETPVRAIGSYNDFIAGTNVGTNGSYFVGRADNNANIETLVGTADVTISQSMSTDNKTLEINVTPNTSVTRGKAFKVILAGYNPTRGNDSAYTIVDRSGSDQQTSAAPAVALPNVLENDYTFSFTVEGDDTTAPKVAETRAYQTAADYVALDGATNVQGALADEVQILLDSKASEINIATATVSLKDSAGAITNPAFSLAEVNGKAAIKVNAGALAGAYELKLEGVKDRATTPNEMSTYKANFVYGAGPTIQDITLVKVDSAALTGYSPAAKASESNFKVQFNSAMNRSTITTDNVKLFDGETLVPVTIDYDQLLANNFVVLKPQTPLASNKSYKVVVTKAVKDTVGNQMQQNAAQAPKDYALTITTQNTSAPKLAAAIAVDETARTITLTFDQKIKTVNNPTVTITNRANTADTITFTNDSAGAEKFIEIDGTKVILTNYDAATANAEYQGGINVTGKDANGNITGTTTVSFNMITTKTWDDDADDAKPTVAALTLTAPVSKTFTIDFSEAVSIDEVKAAFKIYNATDAEDVRVFDSSIVASNLLPADSDYATTFTVTIPGWTAGKDYVLNFAKGSISDYAGFTNSDAYDAPLQ